MTGTCKFCGQIRETAGKTNEEADQRATYYCTCPEALRMRRADDAKKNARELFGEAAPRYGFKIADEGLMTFLDSVIDNVNAGVFESAAVSFSGERATVKRAAGGKIKIQRSSGNKCELES